MAGPSEEIRMDEIQGGTPPGTDRRNSRDSTSTDTTISADQEEKELRSDLVERHVNMIAFSTCVGIGLFLQSGKVIFLAGPGLALLAYLLSGSIIWAAVSSLGEMTALLPVKGGLFVFPRRFVGSGVGYAAGWMACGDSSGGTAVYLQLRPEVPRRHLGTFLALWSAMTTVVFSMIGMETISITAPENKNLGVTETVKMGTRKIVLRILLLYTLSTFVVSFNVPYTDPNLRDLAINSISSDEHSAFILAVVRNHIRVWPSVLNGFFIFSATSAGINSLYLSSRILHALAGIKEVWPDYQISRSFRARLERTTVGVPYGAIFTSWSFGLLAFLATKDKPAVALGRMATNSAVSMLIVYAVVCWSYLNFYECIHQAATGIDSRRQIKNRQAFDRKKKGYPYKSRGQWLKAAYGLWGSIIMVFFNGWRSFVQPFSVSDFIASYISIAIFAAITIAYHISFDGLDPRNWKRHVNKKIWHPEPIVVESESRVGEMKKLNIETVFCRQNAVALKDWILAWVK